MTSVFIILLVVAMLLVLASLFAGLFSMVRGGEFNAKYGNRLMRLRVFFQGLAVLFFLAAVLSARSG